MHYEATAQPGALSCASSSYRLEGKRARLRMVEKGGKKKLVWLHHEAEEFGCVSRRDAD
jgi:hypothetical protein